MSRVTRDTKIVQPMIPAKTETVVTLEVSEAEAQVLRTILGYHASGVTNSEYSTFKLFTQLCDIYRWPLVLEFEGQYWHVRGEGRE